MMRLFSLLLLLLGLIGCASTPGTTTPGATRIDVFAAGHDGYAIYRIPALLHTTGGTLLAFAEGRKSKSDHAENDIVLKRSKDQGVTWGPLQVVAEDGDNCLNNPCVVQDKSSGRIILMYQRFPRGIHESKVKTGYRPDETCTSFITTSDDEGASWTPPRDITAQVKRPMIATSVASGPGIGIQLTAGPHKGRIVFPFNQGPVNQWEVYAVYSDDGGTSWQYGELAPHAAGERGNELQFVEITGGRILLNSRGSAGGLARKSAISNDGGLTWSPLQNQPALPDSRCMGSIIRYDDARHPGLLFLNPATTQGRSSGTLRWSGDEGKTWRHSREWFAGSFAYSCLAILKDGGIAALAERDDYSKITFDKTTFEWLAESVAK